MLLYNFADTLTVPRSSLDQDAVVQKIHAALVAEGGKNIRISGDTITFDGVTGSLSDSRLDNIVTGTIELRTHADSVDLAYVVNIDRWGLVIVTAILVVGMIFMLAGRGPAFLILGIGVLLLSLAYTFVIRFRFRRLLRKLFDPRTRSARARG